MQLRALLVTRMSQKSLITHKTSPSPALLGSNRYLDWQVVLDFLKAMAAETDSAMSASHAMCNLLVAGISVSAACAPCHHRGVALAALACLASIIGTP